MPTVSENFFDDGSKRPGDVVEAGVGMESNRAGDTFSAGGLLSLSLPQTCDQSIVHLKAKIEELHSM